MPKIAGSAYNMAKAQEQSDLRELAADINEAWKLLDTEKALTGRQKVKLQNLLVKVKHRLGAK